jgi:hypothetical protein
MKRLGYEVGERYDVTRSHIVDEMRWGKGQMREMKIPEARLEMEMI